MTHLPRFLGAALLALAVTVAHAQASPPAPTQRLRGTVESFDNTTLVMKERSGELLRLALADSFGVNEVVPTELADIAAGSYIGTAAMPTARCRRWRCWCSPNRRAAATKATTRGTCSRAAR